MTDAGELSDLEKEVLELRQTGGRMMARIRGLRAQAANPMFSFEDRRRFSHSADAQEATLRAHIETMKEAEERLKVAREQSGS